MFFLKSWFLGNWAWSRFILLFHNVTKELYYKLIWRKKFRVVSVFPHCHTTTVAVAVMEMEIYFHTFLLVKISWKQCIYCTNRSTKQLKWRNIFSVRVNFSFFHTMTVIHSVENTMWKLWKFTITHLRQKFR